MPWYQQVSDFHTNHFILCGLNIRQKFSLGNPRGSYFLCFPLWVSICPWQLWTSPDVPSRASSSPVSRCCYSGFIPWVQSLELTLFFGYQQWILHTDTQGNWKGCGCQVFLFVVFNSCFQAFLMLVTPSPGINISFPVSYRPIPSQHLTLPMFPEENHPAHLWREWSIVQNVQDQLGHLGSIFSSAADSYIFSRESLYSSSLLFASV